jgi:hypothetical protein
MHPPIDHVAEEIDDLGPHAGSAGCERVRPEEKDRSDDIHRKRRPDADRMAPEEIALKRAEVLVRDPHGGEVAEAGVDAVHGIVAASDLGDELRCLLDLPLRGSIEAHRDIAARHRDDVRNGEVVAREPQGGYFRFSRYQAPSSV